MTDSKLFRIECFVESRQLGEVMAALSGKVRNMSPPQLVANAEKTESKTNGKALPVRITAADLVDMFMLWLAKHKIKEFRGPVAKQFLQEHGRSAQSYSYLLDRMRAAGRLTKTGSAAHDALWQVRKPGAKKPKAKKPGRDWAAEYARRKKAGAQGKLTTTA